jgi:anaerobic magnesium-protoporphyrin IX monomethyl ester cyclase
MTKDFKILLIYLFAYTEEPAYLERENLGLGYVAACLRQAGFTVRVLSLDATQTAGDRILEDIGRFQPDFVGFSLCFQTFQMGLGFCRRIKEIHPDIHICLGGHHATFTADKILNSQPWVDSVVRGEGEQTSVELVRALFRKEPLLGVAGVTFRENGRIVENPHRPKIENLDHLPFPARDAVEDELRRPDNPHGWIMILGSRGCYGNCSFCSVASFYRLQKGPICRYRSAANVVDEMEELISKYQVVSFLFEDDTFINPAARGKEHARSIAEEIIRRKLNILFSCGWRADSLNPSDPRDQELLELLKRAGLFSVFIGLESGHDEELALYHKSVTLDRIRQMVNLLRTSGISVTTGFIMFNSYSTVEGVTRNADFLRDSLLGTEFRVFSHKVQLHPGVSLIQKLARDGLLQEPRDISDVYYYEFKDKVVQKIAEASGNLYAREATSDGVIRAAIFDSFYLVRKFQELRLRVEHAAFAQSVDSVVAEYQSLIRRLNEANYGAFMSIIRLAGSSWNDQEYRRLEKSYLTKIENLKVAWKSFYSFLCSFMNEYLNRLLSPGPQGS